MTSAITNIAPECPICLDPLEEKRSSILECCKKNIHDSCFAKTLAAGLRTCCFCRKTITNISPSAQAESAVQRAFQEQQFAEQGNRAFQLEFMRNPESQENPSLETQLLTFCSHLLCYESSFDYKKLLWKEGMELISSPIHSEAERHSSADDKRLRDEIQKSIKKWKKENKELILPGISDPLPNLISRDSLKKIARELQELEIPDVEKETAFESFVKDYKNSANDNAFSLFNPEEYSFLKKNPSPDSKKPRISL